MHAWIKNSPPYEWLETIQVPIPKVKAPRTTDDYRRITLCNVGYKIYAKILLDKLDEYLNLPGTYQAAFLSNRSTDDHMYTVRRVLDEEWRAGNQVSVLSIDLKKAFDTVNLEVISQCLEHYIPHYLVDRIIKACFWERTAIKWYNVCTAEINKKENKGVKQGCPISPRLFNFVLNEVLVTVVDQLPDLKLEQRSEIQLPMILAYADDVIIVTRNTKSVEPVIKELVTVLGYAGLEINANYFEKTNRIQHQEAESKESKGIIEREDNH